MVLFLPALFSVGNAGTLGIAIVGLIVFGLGWGFFDCNNMPILCQIARPEWRATGYGIMNMVSISCGGFGDWAFGALRDRDVPLNLIFGVFAGVALLSVVIVLMIRPRAEDAGPQFGSSRDRRAAVPRGGAERGAEIGFSRHGPRRRGGRARSLLRTFKDSGVVDGDEWCHARATRPGEPFSAPPRAATIVAGRGATLRASA